MDTFSECMAEYQKQMQIGMVPKAYKGLMDYILDLRNYFKKKYPDWSVSGSLYTGYMDMTYFALVPDSFKQRGLKIAVVFIHETCRFEVWLSAVNKQVQAEYWQVINDSGWSTYRLVPSVQGYDSILETVLVESPDFGDLNGLTGQIEQGTASFIQDVEKFLIHG
jgi:hypothetical protein